MLEDNDLIKPDFVQMISTAKLNTTGHWWVGEQSEFNFSIKYRPGKNNADQMAPRECH